MPRKNSALARLRAARESGKSQVDDGDFDGDFDGDIAAAKENMRALTNKEKKKQSSSSGRAAKARKKAQATKAGPPKAKPKKAPSKPRARARARPNLKIDTSGGYSRYHGQRRDGKIARKTAPKAGSYEDYDDSDELAAMMGNLSLPKSRRGPGKGAKPPGRGDAGVGEMELLTAANEYIADIARDPTKNDDDGSLTVKDFRAYLKAAKGLTPTATQAKNALYEAYVARGSSKGRPTRRRAPRGPKPVKDTPVVSKKEAREARAERKKKRRQRPLPKPIRKKKTLKERGLARKKHKSGARKGQYYIGRSNKGRAKRPLSNYQKHMQAYMKQANLEGMTKDERADEFRKGIEEWRQTDVNSKAASTGILKTAPKGTKKEWFAKKKRERANRTALVPTKSKSKSKSKSGCQKTMCDRNIRSASNYRTWAMSGGHPDKGGDTGVFQRVSACRSKGSYCKS